MKRIQQLSRQLINQIAAGEVIERPASVVKELVENSIDAGATRIEVEISKDCLDIRVSDNGSGIHPEDIELAFSKHATSKISNADDLFDIHTMGFRGEALASIISIAKVICTTRTKELETGMKVECAESNVKKAPCGCAVGTTMEIKELFYNTPVRQKFLKSERVELSYIAEILQSIAIANPSVSITLINEGKTPIKTSGSGDLLCVLTEIYSNSIASELKKVNKADELSKISVTGYCSTPDFTRSTKKSIYVFVNNRVVKCPVILKAIDTAYKNMLPNGKYPFVCINLEIQPKDVDVNVHPTKKEVRYQNPNQIFNFIYSAILDALSSFKQQETHTVSETIIPFAKNYNTITDENIKEDPQEEDTVYVSQQKFEEIKETNTKQFELNVKQIDLNLPQTAEVEETINIIGQYRNTYIIFEENTELKIVDQHIADERFIFEKLTKDLETKEIPSQLLLISDILELEPADVTLICENSDKLKRFGFGIEQISEKEIVFKKIPQVISHVKTKDIISDLLENLHGDLNNIEEKMLVTMSCKAAVKAGAELNLWQMEDLIKKWKTTKMPYTCPHGRPIVHSFSEKEIASFFHRNA
ncbi:MAG: DNA mismatch repair endonuclease MutL [Clostridium sp.]|nr:DNA mismatch repair endonuclease MutL [Clostridium sp.]